MVSGYWSGVVCGVRYLVCCPIWCLIAGSNLVSTFWTGVWSGVVSGYWFWYGVRCLVWYLHLIVIVIQIAIGMLMFMI